jgi:dihydrodipicolinate synthase/N-acetylneuraminate lyase
VTLPAGPITALLTPCSDDGSIDAGATSALIAEQVQRGIVGLFVLGTAGQGPMLSLAERRDQLERVVNAAGSLSVIVHVGAMPTFEAVALARHAEGLGVAAISSVPPVYYRPDSIATRDYYASVREATTVPLLAYNNPSATGYDISAHEAADLLSAGLISGIKQATGSVVEANRLLDAGVPLWMANADLNFAALSMGAQGTISTITNVAPEPFVALYRAVQDGDLLAARRHQKAIDFVASRLRHPTIGALHYGARLRGWPAGSPRRPLREPLKTETALIHEAVEFVTSEYA